ncbi:MAG: hypothetical protein MUC81_02390 [Bacteroidia bacterium]|jgi:hypothetical protein|nr:hypothetical protein [Bacteroidia bacterium]
MDEDIDARYVDTIREIVAFLKSIDVTTTQNRDIELFEMLELLFPLGNFFIADETFNEVHRLTINKRVLNGENKRIHEIKQLSYPPKKLVAKYGRCNMPNESIFYGAFSMLGVLAELKPDVGDLITHSTWRLKKPNTALKTCSIYKNQPEDRQGKKLTNLRSRNIDNFVQENLKQYPSNLLTVINDLITFIADSFSKKTKGNHREYIFSAFLASKIFNTLENGTIEALCYPSVQMNLSFENLAIKSDVFDEHYQLVHAHDSCVVSRLNGGYLEQGLTDCDRFNYQSGRLLWEMNKIDMPEEMFLRLKEAYKIEL